MKQRFFTAILKAYAVAQPHLMDELPDNWSVPLLVSFTLGDLRELERIRVGENLISGGGPDAPETPRPGSGNADTDLGRDADERSK